MTLFSTIRYHISPSLPPTLVSQLDLVLQANGGTRAEGTKDPALNLVITDSLRFDGWEDVAARRAAAAATSTSNGDPTEEPKATVDVVTPKFVERSVIIGKLQLPQHYSVDPSLFFSGVTACGADLPPSDLEVLSAGITGLGGQWRSALTSECTHLFALTPDSPKYHTAMHFRKDTGIKVVLPHWFDDCVRLGIRGLSEEMYEWPECRVLRGPEGLLPTPKEREKEKGKEKSKDRSAGEGRGKSAEKEIDLERERMKRNLFLTAAKFTPSMNRSSPPSDADLTLVAPPHPSSLGLGPPNASHRSPASDPHAVWEGRKILLSRTLQLYGHRREAVEAGIERAGGQVLRYDGDDEEQEDSNSTTTSGGHAGNTSTTASGAAQGQGQAWNEKIGRKERRRRRREAERVGDCDVYVTRWRYGRAYVQAVREHKMIGTLAWLFHVQSCGIITHPINQLLHYPVPKRPIEAFQKHVITVTNYTGEAREYLKKLVSAMGAEFTPSMSGSNTVVVAAYTSGTKAQKALSWSIPVVNHLWLEDCFIAWRNLTPANEKYIVFRPGEDFSKRLGERGLAVGVANGISGAFGFPLGEGGNGKEKEKVGEGEGEGERELGRIEQEAEELSEDMDEAGVDDLGNSEDDEAEEAEEARALLQAAELAKEKERQRGLQMPDVSVPMPMPMTNGTEASMKEVMDDLVPGQAGGGVDFDVDVDMDLEFGGDGGGKMTSTPKRGANGKVISPVKPTFNPPSSTRVGEKKKNAKARKASGSSDEVEDEIEEDEEEEEEEEEEEARPRKSAKSGKTSPAVVISKSGSAAKPNAKTNAKAQAKSESKAPKAKEKGKAKTPTPSEEEEEEEESASPPPPPKKSKSSVKPKRRARPPTSSEDEVHDEEEHEEPEEDEEAMDVDVLPKSKLSKQKGGKSKEKEEATKNATMTTKSTSATKSKLKDVQSKSTFRRPEAEEEEESTPAPPLKPKATTTTKTKMKPKQTSKAAFDVEEDEDDDVEIITVKAKGKAKASEVTEGLLSEVGGGRGLLGKVKGDARTRIRRKSDKGKPKPKPMVESEDEDEDEAVPEEDEMEQVPVQKTQAKGIAKDKGVNGRKKRAQADDEDEEEDEVESLVTGSKATSKSNMREKAKKVVESSSDDEEEHEEVDFVLPPKKRPKNPPSPAAPLIKARSKPLRVYSTAEEDVDEEEEEEEEIPPPASDGSDSELPENPILSTRSQKPAKKQEQEKKPLGSSSKSKQTKKGVDLKVKGKKAPSPTETNTEEDEQPAKVTTPTKLSPPKRVVSVLMPSLKLSPSKAFIGKDARTEQEQSGSKGKGKAKGRDKKAAVSVQREDDDGEEDDEPQPPVKANKATSKVKSTVKSMKAKAKVAPPRVSIESGTESEEEEKEVSVLVSPRAARALGRTQSIRAAAGQTHVSPSKGGAIAGNTSISSSAIIRSTKQAKTVTSPLKNNAVALSSKGKAKETASISTGPKSKSKGKGKPVEDDDDAMDVDNEHENDGASTSTAPAASSTTHPHSRPSRSAAAKATQRLHETIMPDLVQYEAQKKKSKRLSNSNSAAFALDDEERVSESQASVGKRKQGQEEEEEEQKVSKKRRVSTVVVPEDEAEEWEVPPARSTAKGKGKAKDDAMDVEDQKSAGSAIMIMTTQVTLSEDVIKGLAKLGAKMTSRPGECTHLLAHHVVRTEKFLCALASCAPWILQEDWAIESVKAKRILPEKDFVLKDKSGENKYGVNLAKALRRAKDLKDQGGLLKGHTFYLTPKVPIDTKLLKNVVGACGGLVSTQTPTLRIINAAPTTRHIISSKEDIAIWRPIVSSSKKTRIYTQELLLTGILNQQIEWEKEEFFVVGSF